MPVFREILIADGEVAKKSGIRTGWRRETERRMVATRPEWEAGRIVPRGSRDELLLSRGRLSAG